MTCEEILEQSIEARYVAETLTEAEAEAFEAHYFACDKCWASVRRALEIRAAAAAPASVDRGSMNRRRSIGYWPVLAAATIVIALGVWRFAGAPPSTQPITDATRGATDSIALRVATAGSTVSVSWSAARGAAQYRARLLTSTGELAWSRQLSDTTLRISLDSLRRPRQAPMFLQLDALDSLGGVVARAPLTRIDVGSARSP